MRLPRTEKISTTKRNKGNKVKVLRSSLTPLLFFSVLAIYLLITAPPPLLDNRKLAQHIPIQHALEILNHENTIIRSMYTKEIVGAGKKRGFKFDENWQDKDVIAGPLPAQFLRQTARHLERSRIQLGLYLGSDYAINQANLLEGQQLQIYKTIKNTRNPEFFYVKDANRFAYMFPDIAIAKPCVECHNKHIDSPKTDWKLNDVMGVTTWTFPDSHVSTDELFNLIHTFHNSIRNAYALLVDEMKTLNNPPDIGNKWPKDGYYLPSVDEFMKQALKRTSASTLNTVTRILAKNSSQENKKI